MKHKYHFVFTAILITTFSGVFAQLQVDTAKTHHADKDAKRFAIVVQIYIGRINKAVNMDSVRLIAASMRKLADTLIREVKMAYKINDEALSEADTYTMMANNYVTTKPTIATSYLTIAESKRNESGEAPDYFDALEHIQDIANRLTSSKKIDKAQKLNLKMEDSSKELSIELK